MHLLPILSQYQFQEAGAIVTVSDSVIPKFILTSQWTDRTKSGATHGLVYLWVAVTDHSMNILYVGKAGGTLRKRCAEHTGGFRGGSTTGIRNRNSLNELLHQGIEIRVYARLSPVIMINDESVNSVSIDEESFIMKFRKLHYNIWNT